jgi:hypothetical protein
LNDERVADRAHDTDEPWRITSLRESLAGEQSANLVRLLGLGAFYGIEVLRYHVLEPGVDVGFHALVSAIVVAWMGLGLAVQVALVRRFLPPWLKLATSTGDLALVTLLLLAGDGPRSALVVLYFPILGLAALRFDLRLIRLSTGAAVLSYLVVLGHTAWWRPALRIPRQEELIFGAALATTGIVLGQLVRRARAVARDFALRRERLEEEPR